MQTRLQDLEPQQVARDVAARAIDHVIDLHMRLLDFGNLPSMPEPAHTEIYRTVRTLATYAIRGGTLDAPVHEYLISLIPLYSAAIGTGTEEVDGLVESEPTTDLGIVIAAAVARERLEVHGEDLTSGQFAVLGGYDINYVQALSARGSIPGTYRVDGKRGRKEWRYENAEVRRWLSRSKAVTAIIKTAQQNAGLDEDEAMAVAREVTREARAEQSSPDQAGSTVAVQTGDADFTRITIEPDKMGGVPCIRGLRFPVQTIVNMVHRGMSVDEILADHPDLEAEDIPQAIAFARTRMSKRANSDDDELD